MRGPRVRGFFRAEDCKCPGTGEGVSGKPTAETRPWFVLMAQFSSGCPRDNRFDNSCCRIEAKEYLECRMDSQLMAKEPLEKLGFKDLEDSTKEN
ncbi:unnamed protein product [Leuciscus chuanchicus]